MKFKLFSIVCLLACPILSFGQTVIRGFVVDENGMGLPYANVMLLSPKDSAVITGTVTLEDGSYFVEGETGKLLKVALLGYKDTIMPCDREVMGVIKMLPDEMLLGAATVSAGLPQTRLKGDGMITDVEGTVLETEGRASDMLKRLPGVKAAEEGVEIFGRGTAEVYVNGRKVYDYAEVKQLSSDQIRDVEIITNPGARYPAGTKAVVRIRTKKSAGDGFSFRDNQSFNYEYGFGAYNQLNTNWRKGGLDVSAMLMGNTKNGGNAAYEYIDMYVDGKLLHQDIDAMRGRWTQRNFGTRMQVNYAINDNHSIGVRYDYAREPWLKSDVYLPSVFTYDGNVIRVTESNIHQEKPYYSHAANMYYDGKFGQWHVEANLDAMWQDRKTTNATNEAVWGADAIDITCISNNDSRLYAGKVVAEHPLWGGQFSLGTEATHTRRHELSINPAATDGETRVDEAVLSAFAEYNRLCWKKLYVKVGLRFEGVISDFYEYDAHTMDRDYADWFPSVSLTLPIGKVQLGAHYGIDIARPAFSDLSSNIIYINSYSFQAGNPMLKPTYTHNISFNAAWKWLWGELAWNRIIDGIETESTGYSEDEPMITLLHPANIPSYHQYSATLYASPTFFKVWHPAWGFSLIGQDYEAHCAGGTHLKMNRPLLVVVCNNRVELPKGWSVNADLTVQGKGDYSTYRLQKTAWVLSGKIRKTLLGDRLEAYFQVLDILGQREAPAMVYSYRNLYVRKENRPIFEFSLTYKFNQGQDKYKGSGAGSKQKGRI